jgi:hypothetical protein
MSGKWHRIYGFQHRLFADRLKILLAASHPKCTLCKYVRPSNQSDVASCQAAHIHESEFEEMNVLMIVCSLETIAHQDLTLAVNSYSCATTHAAMRPSTGSRNHSRQLNKMSNPTDHDVKARHSG